MKNKTFCYEEILRRDKMFLKLINIYITKYKILEIYKYFFFAVCYDRYLATNKVNCGSLLSLQFSSIVLKNYELKVIESLLSNWKRKVDFGVEFFVFQ